MNNKKELRLQYMLPEEILAEQNNLPLVFLPLAPLEWHGPHLVLGVDPINAEQTFLVSGGDGGKLLFIRRWHQAMPT